MGERRTSIMGRGARPPRSRTPPPLLLMLLLATVVTAAAALGFGVGAGSSSSTGCMRQRPAGFLPSPSTMSSRRRAGTVLARAGPYGHQQQQRWHQSGPHAGLGKQRRTGRGANPLKAMRRAVALMNGLLQLLFSTGDLFGHVSGGSGSMPAPDLGLRRGGASGSDGRQPPSPSAGPTGGRWRRMRRRSEAAGGEEEDEDEAGAEQVDDGEFGVSKQDLNSWDTWYGGGLGRRQGVDSSGSDDGQGQRGQRRRKKVTFSTRYSCAVSVANGTRLGEYMALPFDQYSLLDQTFISRIEGQEGAFRFTVPANELVGLQTVPIVDVQVAVDAGRRLLTIASIASRLVSRAADGTVLSTHEVGLLANNSLHFSTKISWAEPGAPGQGAGQGLLGGLGRGNVNSTTAGSSDAAGADGGAQQRNGPAANLARLRRRIFQGGGGGGGSQQLEEEEAGVAADGSEPALTAAAATAQERPQPPAGEATAGTGSGGESFQDSTRRKLSRASKRRLTCQARVEVGVVVPPPFSLLPGLVLRQGASLILSTLVSTLTNRFLDLLIEDFQRWARDDEASRLAASAAGGGLLGWDPEQISDRRLSVEAAGEEEDGDGEGPPMPPPEYII